MKALPTTHLEVDNQLRNGQFCVQRGQSHSGQVSLDQAIEQSVNRDTKTKGGIVGFSLNPAAVERWMINAHQRAEISRGVKDMAGIVSKSTTAHKDCKASQMKQKEAAVQSVLATINSMENPFDRQSDGTLFNISSGSIAPDEVCNDLLTAQTTGENKFHEFVQTRLQAMDVGFFDKLPKLKLKTFSS